LADLIEEFSEGKIQFAFVKVTDINTGLPKSVLIAWCGEGVPERTKGYFTSHLSAVSKFLHVSYPFIEGGLETWSDVNSLGLSRPDHGSFGCRFDGRGYRAESQRCVRRQIHSGA
jgi:hypothetical protein